MLEREHLLCHLLGSIEKHIGGGEFLTHYRGYAPGERETAPGALIGGKAYDGHGRTEAGDHTRGHTRERAGDNRLCADIDSHTAGGVGDGVNGVLDVELVGIEALVVVYALLGGLGNTRHNFKGAHGVFARGGLAREHYRAGSVIDRVGNIGYLCSCGAGVVYHGLQHLGSGDNALAEQTALGNKLFLNAGQTVKGHLDTHITASYHNTVAHLTDLVDIIKARLIFYLCDKLYGLCTKLLDIVLHIDKILLAGYEGAGDVVNTILKTELNIALVGIGKVLLLHYLAGEGHTLSVGKLAAVNNTASDIRTAYLLYSEGKQTVVEKDGVTGQKLLGKSLVADADALCIADNILGGEGEGCTVGQVYLTALKGAYSVLGALGIKQDCNGQTELLPYLLYRIYSYKVILVSSVRKVESGNIHSRTAKSSEHLLALAGGADGANDLCFTHIISPMLF